MKNDSRAFIHLNNLVQRLLGRPPIVNSAQSNSFAVMPDPPYLFFPQLEEILGDLILDVQEASNQHCIEGGGGMSVFSWFLRKCSYTSLQDCGFKYEKHV